MRRSSDRALMAAVLGLGWLIFPVQAQQIYSWLDEQGNYHFVDSLTAVPEKHRAAAKTRAETGGMEGDGAGGNYNIVVIPAGATPTSPEGAPAAAPAAGKAGRTGQTAVPGVKPVVKDKAWFQARIRDERARKAEAQAALEGLDGDILRLRATTPVNFQQTLAEIEQKRQALTATIAEADRQLLEVIPAEARKAGAPAGWLRTP